MSVRVAVVGCGHLGTFHARAYARLPGCSLAAVADIRPERAARLGEELGCASLSDHRDLPEDVEAVSIATPTSTHAEIALAMIEAGRHLLVEKPITQDVASGERIVAAARRHGKVLAVGQIERCNPAFRLARPLLSRTAFIEAHRLATFVPRSLDIDVVLDLMIHDIDLVLSIAGARPERIDANGVGVITGGVDIANARLQFPGGLVANLTASRVSRQKMRKIRFFERNLYLSVDLSAGRIERIGLRAAGAAVPSPALPEIPAEAAALLAARGLALESETIEAPPHPDALSAEIEAFLQACRGRRTPVVDGEAGLLALAVALEVRDAVAGGLRRVAEGPAPG